MARYKNKFGITIMEILVVVVIIGALSMALVPVAEISFIRLKETELQENLLEIRNAISRWRYDCEALIRRTPGADISEIPDCNFYPPDIASLAQGIPYPVCDKYGNSVAVFFPRPYMTMIKSDPFVGAPIWVQWYASGTISAVYNVGPATTLGGIGVYDVSPHDDPNVRRGFVMALDGTNYADW